MILIEKEWQDYKDSKTLYKLKMVALFTLLVNIGWHVYSYILTALQSGYLFNFIYLEELSISWGNILKVFNITAICFFLPIVILSNVGAVSRTKMKNAHFFATGVSTEAMGAVKIALSVFVPILVYLFVSLTVCFVANFFFENTAMNIQNTNVTLTVPELYTRPLAGIPFMLMCISIALLAEQIGKDKMVSIFFFFIGFTLLFALLGLSTAIRESITEVYNHITFKTPTINIRKYILGELIFTCLFMISFTLSVIRYAKVKKI